MTAVLSSCNGIEAIDASELRARGAASIGGPERLAELKQGVPFITETGDKEEE